MLRAVLALIVAVTAAAQSIPTDAEIHQILADRINEYKQSVGIVVGVIEPQGRRIITYGILDQNDPRPITGDSVFEIGSITKLFTSLVLADMIKKGEVALNDPLSKYLPSTVRVPEHNGHIITLVDLSTHTSGLSREVSSVQFSTWDNAEGGHSLDQLYEFLASYTRDPGSRFEYSNLGVSLLGIALANRAGMDYPMLVRTRITDPLGLGSTAINLSPEVRKRLATGHSYSLHSAPELSFKNFGAAGSIRSTANDLLTFLSAFLNYSQTPLGPAMASMFDVSRPMTARSEQVHLGWLSQSVKGSTINSHNGETFGFDSFIGFDPKTRTGVVVLSNTRSSGVADIGRHMLNPNFVLKGAKELKPAKQHTEVSVDVAILDRYAGTYSVSKDDIYKVTPVDGHLKMDGPPDPIDFYFPESNLNFFSKAFDGEITFKVDSKGSPIEFIWQSSSSRSKRYKKIN